METNKEQHDSDTNVGIIKHTPEKISVFEHAILSIADPEKAKEFIPYTKDEENKMREEKLRAQMKRFKIINPK